METLIAFIVGVVVGAAVALVAGWLRVRAARAAMLSQVREAFANLSTEALSANNEQFLALARQALETQAKAGAAELDGKKQLIDQTITQVSARLEKLRETLGMLETARKQDYGQLGQRLTEAVQQTAELRKTTDSLRDALSHPQRRGQWGERMADDILQMAGMIEGVNYDKQQTAETGKRPDFTFRLPNEVRLNMDVKFPLDNYHRMIEADSDASRAAAAKAFVADVKGQIRAISVKEYIDPASGTADFVLMFIPNEKMFAELQELDATLLQYAAGCKVVLVGPLSLLAVLRIASQAAETANLSKQTNEAIKLLDEFAKQWQKFNEELDRLGQRLEQAQKSYDAVRTTRSNTLQRVLNKLDDLRGLPGATGGDEQESA